MASYFQAKTFIALIVLAMTSKGHDIKVAHDFHLRICIRLTRGQMYNLDKAAQQICCLISFFWQLLIAVATVGFYENYFY